MNVIGIDIGTTTLSAVALAPDGRVLEAVTRPNGADMPAGATWQRHQDPERIVESVIGLADELMARHPPVAAIGLDGQMHGILYVNAAGRAVSPLFTWQDGRGDLPLEDGTYASVLSRRTGCPMATGFGLTTHFFNQMNGAVPEGAAKICTIADYAAMRLAGRSAPLTHASNAASMGLFDMPSGEWDRIAFANANMDRAILPEVETGICAVGAYRGAAVSAALGDNQASFIGSVRDMAKSVLVNIGTGGQISMMSDASGALIAAERRPLVDKAYLLVGSSLCSGRAYQILEKFLRSCARLAGCDAGNLYSAMNEAGLGALALPDNPVVSPLFTGTRKNPALRGGIHNLSPENFDAGRLVGATLCGMAQELYDLYLDMLRAGAGAPEALVGSGNGIRKNPALRMAFEARFRMPLFIPAHEEEAAYGAALYGMAASGLAPSLPAAQALIRYGA